MRRTLAILFLLLPLAVMAKGADDLPGDSVQKKRGLLRSIGRGAMNIIKEFNNVDTSYIEPQHYKFTATVMGTYNFESYTIKSKGGQEYRFSRDARVRVGPYVGWSLLFYGYTLDLAYISANKHREIEMSIYTSMLGVDFFRKKMGQDYRIKGWTLADGEVADSYTIPFDGLVVSITGLNAYYITNHRKFSYPAAYNQSTCQKKSCGSLLFGGGYTRHSLELDYQKLQSAIATAAPETAERVDSSLRFEKVKYTDVSISAGYAYNWVFSKNWLLAGSLSAALAYKYASGDRITDLQLLNDFRFSNFNFDGVGRFAITWYDTKWYFGADTTIHTYNYRKSQFATNNFFGNARVYIGYNFGIKKNYRKKHE